MAKYPSHSSDPYVDADSGVLKNLLNIRNGPALDVAEAAFAAIRSYELSTNPIEGRFDIKHLQSIHRFLFSDVYAWAGEIRTVDISKGATRFANFSQILPYAPTITDTIARENYFKGTDRIVFSKKAGEVMGELNVLHPFREGNGRALREFIGQLAEGAGYRIDWKSMAREDMTEAAIRAYHGESSSLANLIRQNVVDIDEEAAVNLGRLSVGLSAHVFHASPGGSYEGKVVGITQRYVVQAHGADLILHSRRALTNTLSPLAGEPVVIRYPHGIAGIVQSARQHNKQSDLAIDGARVRSKDI